LLWSSLSYAQTQTEHKANFSKTVEVTSEYQYLLFTPTNKKEVNKKGEFPLIVFLHGAGERGEDLQKVKVHGPPKIVEENPDFPFMVLSPLCPEGSWWKAPSVDLLVERISAKHKVDQDRIYLTGLSMGGYGTWDAAIFNPQRYAAIAPICGGKDENVFLAPTIRALPTWAFHGAMDTVVPIEATSDIVRALKRAGGNVQYTIYPMAGHDSWTETYANEKLYQWMLSHHKQ